MFEEYKSLPTLIRCIQFTDKNKDHVRNILTGQNATGFEDGEPILKVTTIHGEIAIVRIGDWIVQEPTHGFYYPIRDDIFKKKYVIST